MLLGLSRDILEGSARGCSVHVFKRFDSRFDRQNVENKNGFNLRNQHCFVLNKIIFATN